MAGRRARKERWKQEDEQSCATNGSMAMGQVGPPKKKLRRVRVEGMSTRAGSRWCTSGVPVVGGVWAELTREQAARCVPRAWREAPGR